MPHTDKVNVEHPDPDVWLNVEAAAAYAGVSTKSMYDHIYKRRIETGRLGKAIRLKRSMIDRAMMGEKQGGGEQDETQH